MAQRMWQLQQNAGRHAMLFQSKLCVIKSADHADKKQERQADKGNALFNQSYQANCVDSKTHREALCFPFRCQERLRPIFQGCIYYSIA